MTAVKRAGLGLAAIILSVVGGMAVLPGCGVGSSGGFVAPGPANPVGHYSGLSALGGPFNLELKTDGTVAGVASDSDGNLATLAGTFTRASGAINATGTLRQNGVTENLVVVGTLKINNLVYDAAGTVTPPVGAALPWAATQVRLDLASTTNFAGTYQLSVVLPGSDRAQPTIQVNLDGTVTPLSFDTARHGTIDLTGTVSMLTGKNLLRLVPRNGPANGVLVGAGDFNSQNKVPLSGTGSFTAPNSNTRVGSYTTTKLS